MKRILTLLLLTIALSFLAVGCATGPTTPEADNSVVRVQPHFDHEKIQAVNRAASRTGTRVIWVNPPRNTEAGSDR